MVEADGAAEGAAAGAGAEDVDIREDEPEPGCSTAAWEPESCAAGTVPELAAVMRDVSALRFRRCRSVRMSDACW